MDTRVHSKPSEIIHPTLTIGSTKITFPLSASLILFAYMQVGEEEDGEVREVPRVRRLQNPFTEREEPQVLSGARRLNKGARISCLIENLATEAAEDDSATEDRCRISSSTVSEFEFGRMSAKFMQDLKAMPLYM